MCTVVAEGVEILYIQQVTIVTTEVVTATEPLTVSVVTVCPSCTAYPSSTVQDQTLSSSTKLSSPPPSSTTPTVVHTSGTSTSPIPSSSTSTLASTFSHRLNNSQSEGLAFGLATFVAFLLIAACICYRRWKAKRRQKEDPEKGPNIHERQLVSRAEVARVGDTRAAQDTVPIDSSAVRGRQQMAAAGEAEDHELGNEARNGEVAAGLRDAGRSSPPPLPVRSPDRLTRRGRALA